MSIPSRILTDVLLLGGLGVVLLVPTLQKLQLQTPSDPSPTPRHTMTCHDESLLYDQPGCYLSSPTLLREPRASDRYNASYRNYYAGYGAMWDICQGQIEVRGPEGTLQDVSLRDNRILLRLKGDPEEAPNPDFDCDAITSDTPVTAFEPQRLDISTGQHLTFCTEAGVHTLQPEDPSSFTQSVVVPPGMVFNWTFVQPGWYHFLDFFGGGPTDDRHQRLLLIHVTGVPVAFDDSAFVDALPGSCSSDAHTGPARRTDTFEGGVARP